MRKKGEEALRNIAIGVSAETGDKFFASLVRYLAETLDMDYAHICEIVSGTEEKARTIAVYHKGESLENFEYPLAGTPCENVFNKGFCCFPSEVTKLFPGDEMLKKMGMASYIGTPIVDSDNKALGLMVVLGSKGLKNQEIAKSMIQIFAVCAPAELERMNSEKVLLKAKEQAEEATQLKDKFVSLMAHDLQGPFGVILSFLKLILEDSKRPLHKKHKEIIERVIGKGQELTRSIRELLEVSRFKAGKIKARFRFIDGHVAARNITTSLKSMADNKGVILEDMVPKTTRFYADMELFNHVVENFVSNAIKFSKEGDSLTLFVPDGEVSTLAVKDTGVGIPQEGRENLFKYEEKTSTTGTSGERGTGLGLPLCHDIMKTLGGTLDFESFPGEGTCFYIRLPFKRPFIMVIDDDSNSRLFAKKALKGLDSEILEAEDGEKALNLLGERLPHLIILDLTPIFMLLTSPKIFQSTFLS